MAQGGIHFRRAGEMPSGPPRSGAPGGGAAKMLEFEYAAILRDRLVELRAQLK